MVYNINLIEYDYLDLSDADAFNILVLLINFRDIFG